MTEIIRAIRSGLKPLEVAAPLRLSEWAAAHFYLSTESSYVEQRWVAYPYQVAVLDCIGHDQIEEISIRTSARWGYTKMLLAAIGYFAQHKRRNQAVWQPTDDDSDEFVKVELEPMIRDVPVMQSVFPTFLQRHKSNTLRVKQFLGAMLYLRGAKAAKNFRRLTIDVGFVDEVDGCDLDIEGEGAPVELARKRTEGATFPKLVVGSTPKTKHLSQIEQREQQAKLVFKWHIPCPHCGAEHTVSWGGKDKRHGFKWLGKDPQTVAHLCPSCTALYTQAEYLSVWARGRWIAAGGTWIAPGCRFLSAAGELLPVPKHVAFVGWTAMSPQTDWSKIVTQFLSAKSKAKAGDLSELKTFVNLTLGESWEEEVDRADESDLKRRAEPFPLRTVPLGALVLVCSVDVQDNRFHIHVWGVGRGEETWSVDRTVLTANPADERDWEEKLWPYLQTKFPHVAGGKLGIEAAGIDTGGHFTHQAYNFCRVHMRQRIFALRGDPKYGQPVKGRSSLQDLNYRGAVIKNGVKLWHVGTDTAKDLLHGRLKLTKPGPGCIHFSHELPDEFYDQVTSEARVLQKTASGEQHRWVKIKAGVRNEDLDDIVYAIFVAHMLDLHRYTESMWARLEAAVQPPTKDLFLEAPAPAVALPVGEEVQTSAPPRQQSQWQRRPGGYATRWR